MVIVGDWGGNLNESGLMCELTFEDNLLPIKLYQCKANPKIPTIENTIQNPQQPMPIYGFANIYV